MSNAPIAKKPLLDSSTARIPDFIASLREIPSSEKNRIWAACMGEKSVLRNAEYLERGSNRRVKFTVSAIRRAITDYRNAIREALGNNHHALSVMRLSVDDAESLRVDYLETISETHTNLRQVDCQELAEIATALVSDPASKKPMEVAAGLLLLTGRRVTEVLKTGVFTAGPKKRTLTFAGQLKKEKAGSEPIETPPYVIPVLCDPKLILAAIEWLRRAAPCGDITERGVNDRYSKVINAAVKTHFTDAKKGALMPKDLRAIYATTAYGWYAPTTISMNAYFARILGHAELDLATSLSYVKFAPTGEKRAFVSDFRWSLDVAIELQRDALEDEADERVKGFILERIATLEAMRESA